MTLIKPILLCFLLFSLTSCDSDSDTENNKTFIVTMEQDVFNDGIIDRTDIMTYDQHGNEIVVVEKLEELFNDGGSTTTRYKYYNEHNELVKTETYYEDASDSARQSIYRYQYDDDGKLIYREVTTKMGSYPDMGYEFTSSSQYQYNDEGKLISVLRSLDDGENIQTDRRNYEYFENKIIIASENSAFTNIRTYSGENIVSSLTKYYYYDSNLLYHYDENNRISNIYFGQTDNGNIDVVNSYHYGANFPNNIRIRIPYTYSSGVYPYSHPEPPWPR